MAEAPRLPADIIRPVPKPEGLSEEEKTALHNVTSALCNRKQIRDVIEEAVMGTCIALKVPMPDKKKGGKSKKEKNSGGDDAEEQADDKDGIRAGRGAKKDKAEEEEEEEGSDSEEEPEPVLLKRKRDKAPDDEEELDSDQDDEPSDNQEFEGFPDSDAEERAWSRYDEFVAGSSDEEDVSDQGSADEEDDFVDSRARSVRKATADDLSISSSESEPEGEEGPDLSESDSSGVSPPPSKKAKSAKTGPIMTGNSAFLPTLMGGYISGSESEASDLDDGPSRKNRRGQRARQAIWEKKYKEKAKHLQKQQEKTGRDQGWDMRRGAVGGDEDNKPWKKGIQNPFENKNVHPDRQRQMQNERPQENRRTQVSDTPKPKAPPTRDDTGTLHPSWAAAKKAKEEGQKIEFQGRKVVFD